LILVDTSVWIDHIRRADRALVELLDAEEVAQHPYVVGEIALGTLKSRALILDQLSALPSVVIASQDEVMTFIERRRLYGVGVGLVDAHLLVSAHLTPECRLWAHDRRLRNAAASLGVAANLPGR
jgi:predicted nucleic acid-binding protein